MSVRGVLHLCMFFSSFFLGSAVIHRFNLIQSLLASCEENAHVLNMCPRKIALSHVVSILYQSDSLIIRYIISANSLGIKNWHLKLPLVQESCCNHPFINRGFLLPSSLPDFSNHPPPDLVASCRRCASCSAVAFGDRNLQYSTYRVEKNPQVPIYTAIYRGRMGGYNSIYN